MRLPTTFAVIALSAALLFGCGGSDDSTTTTPDRAGKPPASAAPAGTAAKVRASWEASPACKHPQGASRSGCSVGSYRCQAVVTDRGWSVDCARPGRSIAFTVPARK